MSPRPELTGLTRQIEPQLSRSVRRDGSYNVRRVGQDWRAFHLWLHIVNMSWPGFAALVAAVYSTVNISFATIYYFLGPGAIRGDEVDIGARRFLDDFFFSSHTLTTVGYGNLVPNGIAANLTATTEALIGLLGFAVITGLLVARASRPSARIEFSRNALIAPYQDGTGLMLRVANQRSNNLIELEATVILTQIIDANGRKERRIEYLNLEREKVQLFPLTWTLVHPIVESSPLWGATPELLAREQTEFIVLIKGFDETFSQTVYTRISYRADELIWNARFVPAFHVAPEGHYLLELDRVSEYEIVAPYSNSSNLPVSRISRDDDPTSTSNSPGSAAQSFTTGS